MKITKSSKRACRIFVSFFRFLPVFFLSLLALQVPAHGADSEDALDKVVEFNIPAHTRLEDALIEWGTKTGVTVMINSRTVDWQLTQGVRGALSARKALIELLQGSGLWFNNEGGRILIVPKNPLVPSGLSEQDTASPRFLTHSDGGSEGVNGGSDGTSSPDESPKPGASHDGHISEVVVTAEKRTERLQDVPVPVTALSADSLVDSNLLRLQDFYTSVPGLSIFGNQFLSIRGVSTGPNTNPTVGLTVDDVPFGSSTNAVGVGAEPDIDPADLSRIEVLRGPQGTLYGASSMGGLIKYVTVDPSTDAVSGRLQAGTDWTHNGPDPGYNVRGSVNLPLGDTVAIRASGFYREDPGYIDNVLTGERGIDRTDVDGGRLAMLWRQSDTLSLKLSALYQYSKSNGDPHVDVGPGFGDLQQSYIRGTGENDRESQAYSAVLTDKIGAAELTAISGYNVSSYHSSVDFSDAVGQLANLAFGVPGSSFVNGARTDKFTQEVRLTFPVGSMVDWLIGGFYTHERSVLDQYVYAVDPTSGSVAGSMLVALSPSTYTEYAGFTDLTFHLTPQLDLQLGGRESDVHPNNDTIVVSGLLEGGTSVTPAEESSANVFTYLVTPEYKISPDVMLYARLASGYRPGGPNAVVVVGMPPEYGPDKTQNYELGLKADFFDRRLSIDSSLYYIDWRNIQLRLQVPNTQFTYTGNGNTAKSEGVEFSFDSQPFAGFHVSGWVSYDDAALTKAYPTTSTISAVSGNRLPFVPRFSGNLAVRDDFRITDGMTGFVGVTESYVGDRVESIQNIPPPEVDPAYCKMDLMAGVNYRSWTISAYADNVADRRGIVDRVSIDSMAFQFIRPLTVGVNVIKSF
jgi:outer membrane receptor protein involved in Fe transport